MRKLVIVWCLIFVSMAAWAHAESPRVAVMRFTIHSPQASPKTSAVVQELLGRQLAEQGLTVVSVETIGKVLGGAQTVTSDSQAQAAGRRVHAAFVIIGSYNEVGQHISLDARLVDVSGQKKTEPLLAEQEGKQNLALATHELAQQVALRLLAKAIISDIQVKGNERIESAAILLNVKSKKMDLVHSDQVGKDIRAIYQMGFFEDVRADVSDGATGKVLIFIVREKPTVVQIDVDGAKKIKKKDILAAITTKAFTILRRNVVNDDVQRITKLYHEKGYFDVGVDSDISFPKDPRKAVVKFAIHEKPKVYIRKIIFDGNKHFSERKLRSVMETKKKTFYSFLDDSGILQRDVLETDADRLTVFYHDNGFMDAKVGTPRVERQENGFYIVVPVIEGERYKVSSIEIKGDMLEEEDHQELMDDLKLKVDKNFSREKLRDDMDKITKAYMDEGFAYVEVDPQVGRDSAAHTTAIAFEVSKGEKIHIERIYISGNTKTRDKVIRRQLRMAEGDTFSGTGLENSNLALKKIDYFEEFEITHSKGTTADAMNLDVRVKEKATGALSFGGGYSSDEGLFAGGEILQRNLFGKGQYLSLKAHFSGEAQRYSLSFTEPWLFDIPLSAGFDVYDWVREYNAFTKEAQGGRLRVGYPFGQWSAIYGAYNYELANITDISSTASTLIQEQKGRQRKSSVTLTVERDTTDHPFLPTRGSTNSVEVEFSSSYLGSDSDFVSYVVNSGWYVPLWWKFVGFAHGKFGWISELDEDNPVPIYERFYLGGINSIRAFDWGDVGPKDPATGDSIGGLKYALFNLELLFPLLEKYGMRGVFFFDAGNAFSGDEQIDIMELRTAAGGGVRWNSPLGPLRIELGVNLDPKDGEDRIRWQFSTGVYF